MKLTTHDRAQLSPVSPAKQDEHSYGDESDALWRRFLLGQAVHRAGTQSAVARLLGVFPPLVYWWMKGTRPVPKKYTVGLAKIVDGIIEEIEMDLTIDNVRVTVEPQDEDCGLDVLILKTIEGNNTLCRFTPRDEFEIERRMKRYGVSLLQAAFDHFQASY